MASCLLAWLLDGEYRDENKVVENLALAQVYLDDVQKVLIELSIAPSHLLHHVVPQLATG